MQVEFKNAFLKYKSLIRKVFACALEVTGNNVENVKVNICFVQPDEITKLNKEHRGIEKVTDVLSFPMLEINYKQKLNEFDAEREPSGALFIGDIVICSEKAKAQAKEYGNSNKREIVFLALHGFLHLLGYDHMEKEDDKIMQSIAENIMLNFKIRRGTNV